MESKGLIQLNELVWIFHGTGGGTETFKPITKTRGLIINEEKYAGTNFICVEVYSTENWNMGRAALKGCVWINVDMISHLFYESEMSVTWGELRT